MDELLNERLNGCILISSRCLFHISLYYIGRFIKLTAQPSLAWPSADAPRDAHVRPGTTRVQEHPGATVRAKDGGEEPSTARRPACAQERAETAGVTWSA